MAQIFLIDAKYMSCILVLKILKETSIAIRVFIHYAVLESLMFISTRN